MLVIRTIDAHVGGQPLRLIVDGLPAGTRFTRSADPIRRAIVRPPRGHDGMTAALLGEPVNPGSHASLTCLDVDGYPPIIGHAVMAAATIAIERGLLFIGDGPERRVVFDTLAGTVTAIARVQDRGGATRVDSVAMINLPAFVHTAAHPVRIGSRELRVDIAYGGLFHAIVDAEAIGIPLDPERLPELRRLAIDVLRSLNAATRVEHPVESSLRGVAAVTITSAPRDPEAHLRNVTIGPSGAVDPSAGVTGTCAVMAVLDAMGLLPDDHPFVHEGLSGALLRGRPLRRTEVGDRPAIVPEITGTAWITGDHAFLLDDDDPFREGF